jgi:hypothetical protein
MSRASSKKPVATMRSACLPGLTSAMSGASGLRRDHQPRGLPRRRGRRDRGRIELGRERLELGQRLDGVGSATALSHLREVVAVGLHRGAEILRLPGQVVLLAVRLREGEQDARPRSEAIRLLERLNRRRELACLVRLGTGDEERLALIGRLGVRGPREDRGAREDGSDEDEAVRAHGFCAFPR